MRFSLGGVWEGDRVYLGDVCACEYIWVVCVRAFGYIWLGRVSENVGASVCECGFI